MEITKDFDLLIRNAIKTGKEYVNKNKIGALVLGVSGGIDSAVTAFLAREVCDQTGAQLIARSMPIVSNKPDELSRAKAVGEEYAHDFEEVCLDTAYFDTLKVIDKNLYNKMTGVEDNIYLDDKVLAGNVKARIRMIYLYHLARKNNGMVLSTDNLTELMLGFWTLHGDVGDFGFIQNAWKTEVYGMGDIIGETVAECCAAKPTDGLGITNSDIDQLLPDWTEDMGSYRGAYREVDDIIVGHMNGASRVPTSHPVIQRVINTKFKRENPVSIPREILTWRYN